MAKTVLATQALTKRYSKRTVVNQVNFAVQKGQVYGLIGKNGAGKTTLLRMLTGQSVPDGGQVELFCETTNRGLQKARRRTGAIVETPGFYPFLSAAENLEYYRLQRGVPGKSCVYEALELVDLAGAGKKTFKNFSLGMKQRLGLALALMSQPELLLLDEPINGLDPQGIAHFRSLMQRLNRERGITVLISSHILSELSAIATNYGFLHEGIMLEQISAQSLREKCRECLDISVDEPAKAVLILESRLNIADYEVLPGGMLRIYEKLNEPQVITAALVSSGIAVTGIQLRKSELEDYFLSLIGGGKRA